MKSVLVYDFIMCVVLVCADLSNFLLPLQDLQTKLSSLQTTIGREKTVLKNLCDEQNSMEQILDRTADLYRQTHGERKQLVQTWREAVTSLATREIAIARAAEVI